jgi:hypothetical protein
MRRCLHYIQEEVEVSVEYVTVLRFELGKLKFWFPSLHQGSKSGSSVVSVSTHPQTDITSQFKMEVFTGTSKPSIQSQSHPDAVITYLDAKATVAIKNFVKHDVVLLMTAHQSNTGTAISHPQLGAAAMLTFYCKIPDSELEALESSGARCEFVFLIDRSGSMSGGPWRDARYENSPKFRGIRLIMFTVKPCKCF